MKKIGLILVALVGLAGMAQAATVSASLTVTNTQAITYSDPIQISGTLQKIEVVQSAGSTSTVTVASYNGTNAVDTFASLTSLVGSKVVRLMVAPTDNTGTAIASSTNNATAVGTVLAVPYVQPYIGGNVKLAVTAAGSATGTNTVTVTLFYEKPMSW